LKKNGSLDELAKALFEAARQERPSDEVRSRAGRLDQPPARRALRWRPVLAALGAAAILVFGEVLLLRSQQGPSISASPEHAPSRPAVANQPPATSVNELSPEEPRPLKPRVRRLPPRETPTLEIRSPASLAEEIAALDGARTALHMADPALALSRLDEYDHALRGTRLTAEATLLRIEALARAGNQGQASELARRFIDNNPGSALADRARAFVRNDVGGARPPGADSGGIP
jgi:hypothetical protein